MFVNLARVEEGASDRVKALEEGSPLSRLQLYTKGREQAEAGDNIGCVKKKKKISQYYNCGLDCSQSPP